MQNLKTMLIGLLMFAATASAQAQNGTLDIRTIVQKEVTVVADDGSERTELVVADLVTPGDQVIYTLTYANVGDEPAENIVITNPLPTQLTYIAGSATGEDASVQFSVDGVNYGQTSELTVVNDGIERPARSEDITHIRWIIAEPIEPGEEGIAQFRARLN